MTKSRFNDEAQRLQLRRWARQYIEYRNENVGWFGQWDDVDPNDHIDRPDDLADLAARPFVMRESSRYGQTWITLWPSPEEAAAYHFGQEYAEDWEIDELFDLRNGDRFHVDVKPIVTKEVRA